MNIMREKGPDIKRLTEIVRVLAKYEFGNVVKSIGLNDKLPLSERFKKTISLDELEIPVPERLRLVLEELGTAFIKLGQVLSTRPDLVGEEFSREFSKLQDATPPLEPEVAVPLVEEELGKSLEDVFSSFNTMPLASASIGQVHRAVLKNGDEVAVKIQRPGLEKQIKQDIRIMRYLAGLIDKRIPKWKYYNLPGIVDEFERSILKEMDYQQEARNAKEFCKMFQGDRTVYVPRIYDEHSTTKVLTMEFIDGVKVRDLMEGKNDKLNKKLVAKRGAESYFKQVLIHGFFHADPHPGNIYVLKHNIVCFLDFGMMGRIDEESRESLAELFIYIINYDINGIINQLNYMEILNDKVDKKSLKYDLMDFMEKYYGADIKAVGNILKELSNSSILEKHHIKFPRELVLLGRVITMVEDMGQKLDPEFNAVEISKPLVKKLLIHKLSPFRFLDFLGENTFEFEHLLKAFPKSLNKTLTKLEEGRISIEMEHKNLNTISINLSRASNRISLALIISALIIGSSLIMQTNKGILLLGFPFLGVIGFTLSALLGFALVISILKHNQI